MNSFEHSISVKRAGIVNQLRSIRLVVAVLGPGEGHPSFPKRCQIRDSLVADGIEAFFPEDVVDKNSGLSLLDEERMILEDQQVGLVVALDTSEGPLAELSAFAQIPLITKKTVVLVPDDYYAPGANFPSDILERYSNRWRFTREELLECSLVRECTSRARNERLANWPPLDMLP